MNYTRAINNKNRTHQQILWQSYWKSQVLYAIIIFICSIRLFSFQYWEKSWDSHFIHLIFENASKYLNIFCKLLSLFHTENCTKTSFVAMAINKMFFSVGSLRRYPFSLFDKLNETNDLISYFVIVTYWPIKSFPKTLTKFIISISL